MRKINLKGVKTKNFSKLLKKSSAMDNLMFIKLNGSQFESTMYNFNKSALKSVSADIEKMCDEISNPFEDTIRIQFKNAKKLITTLSLVENVTFDLVVEVDDDTNYAKKVIIKDSAMNVTINCADKEELDFLEIPDTARYTILEDTSKLQMSVNITKNEFNKIIRTFKLNKDSVRVFFNLVGDEIVVSEIDSGDSNVRSIVNDIILENNYNAFRKFDKLYDMKLVVDKLTKNDNVHEYLACFNKNWFVRLSPDPIMKIEFHTNKIQFISVDDADIKTYFILTPVWFA